MQSRRELLSPTSAAFRLLDGVACEARIAVFCGIPGTGKSLLIREQMKRAIARNRRVSLLQWDVSRQAFEQPQIVSRFPEVDGSTHLVIRRAVGLWARSAIHAWSVRHTDPEHLLLIEAPLIEGRLTELAHVIDDAAEPLLRESRTRFLVPTPTAEVRAAIEAGRREEMREHRHHRDAANAIPELMEALWKSVASAAEHLQIEPAAGTARFCPATYLAVYRAALRYRLLIEIPVEEVIETGDSPHAFDYAVDELLPSPAEVPSLVAAAASENLSTLAVRAERWFEA